MEGIVKIFLSSDWNFLVVPIYLDRIHKPYPFNRPITDPRWLRTSVVIKGTYLPQAADQDYVWRRIQVSQVQAEKQKKSVLQLAMVFHARTAKLMQDFVGIH